LADDESNFKSKVYGLKGLASISLADIGGSGISALFWFLLASIIEVEQYGEITYFIGIAGITQLISLLGASNVLTVYTAKKINIQSTLFTLSLIVGGISSIVVFLIFSRIDVSVLIFGFIISELVNAVLFGKKSFSTYSKLILLQKISLFASCLIFYFLFGIEGILYGMALSYLGYIPYIIKEFKETKINFGLIKPRAGYIVNNYLWQLSGGFVNQLDKIIIAPVLGFVLLGNYALAYQFFILMLVLPHIVFKYLLPHDATGNQNKKLKITTIISSVGITILGIILAPIIIPHLFPKYTEVVEAIQIMSIAVIPATIGLIYSSKFLGQEKSKPVFISSIVHLVILASGMIILGPIFGLLGIVGIFVIASSIRTILLVYLARFLR